MATRPPTDPPARRYASIEAAAQYLDCSAKTVRRMIAKGELSAYRLGERLLKVDLNEVDRLLRRIPTADAGDVA